jgi:hypothetical protein
MVSLNLECPNNNNAKEQNQKFSNEMDHTYDSAAQALFSTCHVENLI